MLTTICLLLFTFWGSSVAWRNILGKWWHKQPVLERVQEPVPSWRTIPELTAAFIVLMLVCLAWYESAHERVNREPLSLALVATQVAISLGLVLFLTLMLRAGGHPLSCYGMKLSQPERQLKLGLMGFFAAVIPMALSMILTFPFRSRETEHSLLKLLNDSPDVLTVGLVVVAAVLSAPLWEELQFRVILQGWLSTFVPPALSISIVACTFSLVHGWRDGLALLPLALILGYVFDRRRSYLSVVVIHALFNATMITLELLSSDGSQ